MNYAQRHILETLCKAQATKDNPMLQHDLDNETGLAMEVFNEALAELVTLGYVDHDLDSDSPISLTPQGMCECSWTILPIGRPRATLRHWQ